MYDQHDSTATPPDPPQCITQLIIPRTVSDVSPPSFLQHPVLTMRAFRLDNLGLTDLRSARVRLRDSLSSGSVSSTSIDSSGAPLPVLVMHPGKE